jgi:hypothetical protein
MVMKDSRETDWQFATCVDNEVRCVQNEGYEVDLRVGCVYQLLPDPVRERRGFLRVIDEDGEDFMFPKRCYLLLEAAHAEKSPVPPSS